MKTRRKPIYSFWNSGDTREIISWWSEKLEKLEKEGQELYSQILQEGKDHNDAVMKKIEQATANVDNREKLWKWERNARKSSERNEICSRKYREAWR